MDEFNYFAYVNDKNVVEQVITCDDPDKLRSKDPALIKGAKEKFQEVQKAYEEIQKARSI